MRTITGLSLSILPLSLAAQTATLFHNVRVFDGERTLANRDVLVQGGKIARVAAKLTPPVSATVIDGSGKTLLPVSSTPTRTAGAVHSRREWRRHRRSAPVVGGNRAELSVRRDHQARCKESR